MFSYDLDQGNHSNCFLELDELLISIVLLLHTIFARRVTAGIFHCKFYIAFSSLVAFMHRLIQVILFSVARRYSQRHSDSLLQERPVGKIRPKAYLLVIIFAVPLKDKMDLGF